MVMMMMMMIVGAKAKKSIKYIHNNYDDDICGDESKDDDMNCFDDPEKKLNNLLDLRKPFS